MRVHHLIVAPLVAVAALAAAAPASAAPVTTVTHEHGLVENFVDTLPTCDPGELYSVTTTTNLVNKETANDDGTLHATFTQTGKVSASPLDGTGPTYTGQVTIWGGFNQNAKETNGTFTFNVKLTGSDGSRISTQQVDHFDQRPDGSVHEFFKCQ